jgi:uncharacterized protein YndB with AHSA1/START domain
VAGSRDKDSTPDDSRTLSLTTREDREIVMTRAFDAPRRLVFDAFTKSELVKRWLLGPPGWSMPVCEIDLRVGGAYRYIWRHADGKEMGMRGVYREVAPPERIVCTELFDEPWYPGEALTTTALAEHGGRTTVTITILYISKEARDGVLNSGVERGVAASYDHLEEILALRDDSLWRTSQAS